MLLLVTFNTAYFPETYSSLIQNVPFKTQADKDALITQLTSDNETSVSIYETTR